ncbi:Phosphopantetheine adenylyltransferase [Methylobrevis pamukkalensis]|uniref:Phosphopantetheine adenylyltransferase n=1 Tax=Methylobrevis pamukkalensis TaxID=1439726 RepID=A0A1E3GXW7_9HYPH|nr:Phosphopantetheine adenylyltransferase [Methylobrevis pamukkalensis]
MTKALYSGSFDPVTNGHIDIFSRAARLFDGLVIAVGAHHSKTALLAPDERVALLKSVLADLPAAVTSRIEVVTFDGLVVDVARRTGATSSSAVCAAARISTTRSRWPA